MNWDLRIGVDWTVSPDNIPNIAIDTVLNRHTHPVSEKMSELREIRG